MAAIFILFPKDNAEYAPAALQHFQWAVERFEAMSERNRLAAAARGVLHAVHVHLKRALAVTGPTNFLSFDGPYSASPSAAAGSNGSASSNADVQTRASPSTLDSRDTRHSSIYTQPDFFHTGGPPIDPSLRGDDGAEVSALPQPPPQQGDWTLPEGFDWTSIQPVYAMADIAYNDLMGISSGDGGSSGTGGPIPNWAGGAPMMNGGLQVVGPGDAQGWSFGGDFGSDSVWSVLNQYPIEYGASQ